ncbi:hypothetical protein NMY22_g12299 [Coprinellus aureogranulatus]|nr:hypothetical protein NMY22_g12299 [Coprinellus aureogranulatus]
MKVGWIVHRRPSLDSLPDFKGAAKQRQAEYRATLCALPSLPSLSTFAPSTMAESYTSRTTDVSANGYPNSSQPSLVPAQTPSNIIRKKLMGYVGFANLPNQVHRKSVRKGFQFTAMVVGESGLGKSTLINTLFNTTLYPPKEQLPPSAERPKTVAIESIGADIEENGVRLHLTVVDTPGFGDFVNNDDSWKPIVENIESRFDSYLEQENRVNRTKIVDNRVHACLYFIQPTGHSLKQIDIEFMRRLHTKVNLIPIIAKADTLTDEEVAEFKQRVRPFTFFRITGVATSDSVGGTLMTDSFPLAPTYDNEDEETLAEAEEIASKIPFAVVGSDKAVVAPDGREVRGRAYPWGVVEVDNEDHCDFVKLRQMLVRTYMEELREYTNDVLYENWRTEKLLSMGVAQDSSVFKEINPAARLQEERILHEAKLAKMEAEMKMVFQQKVQEKESKLKQSEEELYARHKEMKDALEKQRAELEDKKRRIESGRPLTPEKASTGRKKGFLPVKALDRLGSGRERLTCLDACCLFPEWKVQGQAWQCCEAVALSRHTHLNVAQLLCSSSCSLLLSSIDLSSSEYARTTWDAHYENAWKRRPRLPAAYHYSTEGPLDARLLAIQRDVPPAPSPRQAPPPRPKIPSPVQLPSSPQPSTAKQSKPSLNLAGGPSRKYPLLLELPVPGVKNLVVNSFMSILPRLAHTQVLIFPPRAKKRILQTSLRVSQMIDVACASGRCVHTMGLYSKITMLLMCILGYYHTTATLQARRTSLSPLSLSRFVHQMLNSNCTLCTSLGNQVVTIHRGEPGEVSQAASKNMPFLWMAFAAALRDHVLDAPMQTGTGQ